MRQSVRTWTTVGIELPPGVIGQVRILCPQCSASRHKHQDLCLAVNVDEGTWHCWHCGWKGGLHSRHEASLRPLPPALPAQPTARKRAALRRVWSEASPLAVGDPALVYLRRRGINLPQNDIPTVLRCHRHLAYRHDDGQHTYHPAMVARVDDPSGHAATLHRTYLALDGRKADVPSPKKLMSPAIPGATRGGAIRLYPAGSTLAVCEGIETALAVRLATGLPTWSTICADGMAKLVVPPDVSLVVIAADHDPAGLTAARALARRLLGEQRRAKILTPDRLGADWVDVLGVAHG